MIIGFAKHHGHASCPAKLGSQARRKLVAQTAFDAAKAYYDELARYNDHEFVLLRVASAQV